LESSVVVVAGVELVTDSVEAEGLGVSEPRLDRDVLFDSPLLESLSFIEEIVVALFCPAPPSRRLAISVTIPGGMSLRFLKILLAVITVPEEGRIDLSL